MGFEIVGLYHATVTAFYCLYHEQSATPRSGPARKQVTCSVVLALVVVSGIMAPAELIARSDSVANWFRFILPLAFIGLVLMVE